MLAGVSSTYYTRLEQGLSSNASPSVLEAITRALQLNEAERSHLIDLAKPNRTRRRAGAKPDRVRPGTLRLIESMPTLPAIVLGRRSEVLAGNSLGHKLVGSHVDVESPHRPVDRPNLTRMLFLDAHTRELYARWGEEATRAVSSLRLLAGRLDDDQELINLVGELTVRSSQFAKLWAKHPVELCMSGLKYFRHPTVGLMELHFEVLTMPDDSGQRILIYTAEPDSPNAEALQLLQSTPI